MLLLHGFPDSLQLWRDVAPRLVAAGYRVIALDQRGFGESDAPAGRHHYVIDRLVADMAALLHALGGAEPVHVVGHDWGAVVTWCLAMTRPQLLRSAVAISVGHPREYALAGLEQKIKGLYTLGWQFTGLAERWLAARATGRGCDTGCGSTPTRSRASGTSRARGDSRPASTGIAPTSGQSSRARGPTCRVPMLGLWSSEDHCLAEDQMARSSRRMAAPWAYERIDGAGHWLPLERPDRVADLAIDWFRRS